MELFISFVITVIAYGVGPAAYSFAAKKPVKSGTLVGICVACPIVVFVLFTIIRVSTGDFKSYGAFPAFFWGIAFYYFAKWNLRRRGLFEIPVRSAKTVGYAVPGDAQDSRKTEAPVSGTRTEEQKGRVRHNDVELPKISAMLPIGIALVIFQAVIFFGMLNNETVAYYAGLFATQPASAVLQLLFTSVAGIAGAVLWVFGRKRTHWFLWEYAYAMHNNGEEVELYEETQADESHDDCVSSVALLEALRDEEDAKESVKKEDRGNKKNAILACCCGALALTTVVFAYQSYTLNVQFKEERETSNGYAEEIHKLNNDITRKDARIAELREIYANEKKNQKERKKLEDEDEIELGIYRRSAVLVIDGDDKYYHTNDCEKTLGETYYIYNVEWAEAIGYIPDTCYRTWAAKNFGIDLTN